MAEWIVGSWIEVEVRSYEPQPDGTLAFMSKDDNLIEVETFRADGRWVSHSLNPQPFHHPTTAPYRLEGSLLISEDDEGHHQFCCAWPVYVTPNVLIFFDNYQMPQPDRVDWAIRQTVYRRARAGEIPPESTTPKEGNLIND